MPLGRHVQILIFERDQLHIRDLESDLNASTCALQLSPSFSHCPLKIAQRAGHRFTLIFIEQSSSKGRPVAEMNDESESRILPNVLSIFTTPIPINVPVQGDL